MQTCEVVDLLMETRGSESLQLSFLAVPLICCDPLVNQPLSHVVEMFPHLSGLDLADIGGETDIDVLVGSDRKSCLWRKWPSHN